MQIELTPNQIATAVMEGDYPESARNLNAIGKYINENAEDDDKHYRWRRHLVERLDEDGIKFFKGMAEAIAHHEKDQ